jgi:hypothetical protein
MKDHRGRPKENDEAPIKYEINTIDHTGEKVNYKFDRNRHPSGTVRVDIEHIDSKSEKPEIRKNQKYLDSPVVVAFKTSKRANAITKIKVFANKNLDDVLTNPQPGIPEKAVWLDVGVGTQFEQMYKIKYKLT